MLADTGRNAIVARHARPSALRDLKRDWESWSLLEKLAMAMIASCALVLLSLTHLLGTI